VEPAVKAFYARLVAAGKPKMVALGAAMRKLLMIAVGVLRSGKPFDPSWAERLQQRSKVIPATP
jgi:transposase